MGKRRLSCVECVNLRYLRESALHSWTCVISVSVRFMRGHAISAWACVTCLKPRCLLERAFMREPASFARVHYMSEHVFSILIICMYFRCTRKLAIDAWTCVTCGAIAWLSSDVWDRFAVTTLQLRSNELASIVNGQYRAYSEMTYHLWTKSVLDCSLCCWH